MPDDAALTTRDLADFARRALEHGLLTPAAVVAWADAMIEADGVPPSWVIELSLAPDDRHETIVRLRQVPGTPTDALPAYLFLALVAREWRRGTLSVERVRSIGWRLHLDDAIPKSDGQADWGVVLECEFDMVDEGYGSKASLPASIDEHLRPYAEYEGLLPPWATFNP